MSAMRPPREIARATLLLAGAQATLSACLPLSATIGSVQAVDLAGHHEAAGGAVAVALAGAAVALPIAGTLSDRHGRRVPLALGFAALGVGGLVAGLAVLAESAPLFFAAIAVFGAGGGLALLSRAAAADLYPPRLRAHGVGLVATAGAIGATLGPLIWTSAEALGGALGITRSAVPWLLLPIVAGGAVAALHSCARIRGTSPRISRAGTPARRCHPLRLARRAGGARCCASHPRARPSRPQRARRWR